MSDIPLASTPSPMAPLPEVGRQFSAERIVRLGDSRPTGELRLDGLARYTQDVSNDDTADAALPDQMAWIARRTAFDVHVEATLGETLQFTTFCSGLGSCWAERRLHITGDGGAHYEAATLWVHIDDTSGRPRRLSEAFLGIYQTAAGGRKVTARLEQPAGPERGPTRAWPSRVVDFDVFNHMNNAAYWAAAEEHRSDLAAAVVGHRWTIEYRDGISPNDPVTLAVSSGSPARMWWMTGTTTAASVQVDALQ